MTLEIAKKKNDFGHEIIDCPFCGDFVYVRDPVPMMGREAATDLYRHIRNQAKNEALEFMLDADQAFKTPHLDFYKNNTSTERPRKPVPMKRFFKANSIEVI